MKIKMIKIEDIDSNQIVVCFTSEFGSGKARWNGEHPLEGREYYVELEIPDTLVWSKDLIQSDKEKYGINNKGNSPL